MGLNPEQYRDYLLDADLNFLELVHAHVEFQLAVHDGKSALDEMQEVNQLINKFGCNNGNMRMGVAAKTLATKYTNLLLESDGANGLLSLEKMEETFNEWRQVQLFGPRMNDKHR